MIKFKTFESLLGMCWVTMDRKIGADLSDRHPPVEQRLQGVHPSFNPSPSTHPCIHSSILPSITLSPFKLQLFILSSLHLSVYPSSQPLFNLHPFIHPPVIFPAIHSSDIHHSPRPLPEGLLCTRLWVWSRGHRPAGKPTFWSCQQP